MDRMRTSLFSILGPLEGLSFLDLFAGSGLMGLEAASRGASPIDLVEKDFGKKAVMLKNLLIADAPIELHMADVKVFLKRADRKWDVIYLDPPFPMAGKLEVLQLIGERDLLSARGSLLLHYPGEESFPEILGPYRRYDHREYGRSQVIFYTQSSSPQ